MERLTEETYRHLRQYLSDLSGCHAEIPRRETFAALLGRLFPDQPIGRVAHGGERSVRIDLGNRTARRSIDTFHGNAVIEFENNLRVSGATAMSQLKEYTSGIWREEGPPRRSLLAVGTDGARWKVFRPTLVDQNLPRPTPQDVILGDPIQDFEVRSTKGQSLEHFYFWLQNLLFRPQQIVPTAALFTFDFGTDSLIWADARRRLRAAWDAVASANRAQTAFDAWRRYLRYTYALEGGEAGLVDLFLRHTYLVSVARLLAWAALSSGKASSRATGSNA
ncbi:MAG: hypothetical protein ABSH08_18685, partial [Tepidisphaeraceae bacterium]